MKPTKEQYQIAKHLLKGGEIQDVEQNTWKLQMLTLESENSAVTDEVDLSELDLNYEIYIDPRDVQIEELKDIIRQQSEVIQELSKKKQEPTDRKERVTLNHAQKRELIQYAKDHPKSKLQQIADMWEISHSSAHRILASAHVSLDGSRGPRKTT